MASVLLVVGVVSAILTVGYAGGLFRHLLASRPDAGDDRLAALDRQLRVASATNQQPDSDKFGRKQSTVAGV